MVVAVVVVVTLVPVVGWVVVGVLVTVLPMQSWPLGKLGWRAAPVLAGVAVVVVAIVVEVVVEVCLYS
jgi:hypothetical protein